MILSSIEGTFLLFVVLTAISVSYFKGEHKYLSMLLMSFTFYIVALTLCVINPNNIYSSIASLNSLIFINHMVSLAGTIAFTVSKLKTINKAVVLFYLFVTWSTLLSLFVMATECV